MAEKQKTIKAPVSFAGNGLHTGMHVEMTVKPAAENHGYVFQRVDIEGNPIIHAIVDNVVDTARSTVLEENGARIGTVEHILSALYGLGIDNALIEISAAETPILDGSSKPYVDAFLEVGIIDQNADKDFFVVKNNIGYSDEERGIEIMTFPDDGLSMHVMIDYNNAILGNQYASMASLKEYREQISGCRTFVLLRELEILLKKNLIKGGDLDNALVICDREMTQEEMDRITDLFGKPRMKVKPQGVLNNKELAFTNEPARHKLLDLLGDISLIGQPIKGKILATRPGHFSNVEFAKKIRAAIKKSKAKSLVPEFDLNEKPFYDINQVKKLLPHRPPFLLVDKILKLTKTEIYGLKNVTINEPFFIGHFPDFPVMPGVLIVEALAQTGGILVLSQVEDPENYLTFFLSMDKVKFRKQVVPGDTLIFKLELIEPVRRGLVKMRGQAFVGEAIAAEGEFMAQIAKTK